MKILKKENLSGAVIDLKVSGNDAIKKKRTLIGPSNVKKAKEEYPNNLIHASDSIESALEKIDRFFNFNINDYLNNKIY